MLSGHWLLHLLLFFLVQLLSSNRHLGWWLRTIQGRTLFSWDRLTGGKKELQEWACFTDGETEAKGGVGYRFQR